MRRSDRAQGSAFCREVMDHCTHGVVSISTGEETPYCVPLSLVRVGESIYFHCAREGRKVELLRKNPRVCVTFVGEDQPDFVPPAMYTTYFQSVIAVGTAVEVTDAEEKIQALRALCQKLTPEHMEGFERAIESSLAVTAIWRIDLEQMEGKARRRK